MAVIELYKTGDDSYTLNRRDMDETYHSRWGALSESKHVFILNGLMRMQKEALDILEVGMGTCLNVLVSLDAFLKNKTNQKFPWKSIQYTGLEPFPVPAIMLKRLQYNRFFENFDANEVIKGVMKGEPYTAENGFSAQWLKEGLGMFTPDKKFDVIYFDAFAPTKQPDLWTLERLQKCYDLLNPGGVWVTYSARGQLKRDLKEIGFTVQNPPGAMGKKEMTVAIKPEV